ncbi:MAG: Uncharacterised protein [Synechococcus sp. MIT S9220]|nr:MAG: Uncharacterised protein [Synechococcus sp. MIT S9220]
MHLIDKQDGAQPMAFKSLTGIGHFGAQVFHARQHGIERAEMGSCVVGNDSRQGGLSDSRRAMQDQIADTIG